MEMGQVTLNFPGVPAKVLQEKCKDAMERFNLTAEYQDEHVRITGPREILEQLTKLRRCSTADQDFTSMDGEINYDETTLELALGWIDWKSLVLNDGDSGMGDIITGIDSRFSHKKIKVMLAYNESNDVVGWAWSLNYSNHNDLRRRGFMLYIQPDYRRKGIGTHMVEWGREVARSQHKKFMCFPWDDQSEYFFDSQKIKDKNQGYW